MNKEKQSLTLSLRARALRAGIWTMGSHGGEMTIRLISTLIMTRLLFPEAFGLMAAATSLLIGLGLISDLGIRAVVVQSPNGDVDQFLQCAWTIQACRGVAMWLMLVAICALLYTSSFRVLFPPDSVFADPAFPLITVISGLNLIFGGLESTSIFLNARRLNLKPIFFLDLCGKVSTLPAMIIWAWLAPSVWALAGGGLFGSVVRLIFSHTMLPGPSMFFRWDREYVQEIVHFGKWITASSAATFVGTQSDRIILGLLLPAPVFGLYAIAKLLIETSQGVFERLTTALALPLFGEVVRRGDPELGLRYYQFRLPFSLATPLVGGILFSAGSSVVNFLFDHRYAGAGAMVQILAISLAMFPGFLVGALFTAVGEPRISAIVSGTQAVSLVFFTIGGYLMFGIVGSLWGVALHKLVPLAVILTIGRAQAWIDFRKELMVVPMFVLGIVVGQAILYAIPLR